MSSVDMSGLTGAWEQVNVLANLAIVAGYLAVPFTVLRYLPLRRGTIAAGALFFLTCALTHLSMAAGVSYTRWMVVNHAVQAGAVIWFVVAFYRELRAAVRARVPAPRPPDDEQDTP